MADSNNRIKVDELNFDGIKANLKTFMSGQEQFKDYNFDGSGMSVLLDVLAYNTHYNALYNNMAVNEMFLDSASKRDSVVSLARMIGYTPKSMTCAKAYVTVSTSGYSNAVNQLILPAKTKFNTQVDGVQYSFLTQDDIIANYDGSTFSFKNIAIIEGKFNTQSYIVEPSARFLIPNLKCDTQTIKVYVSDSSNSSNPTAYTLSDSVLLLSGSSTVYFLKEISGGLYEIQFGDGVLGNKLLNGNLVTITYMTTSGDLVNDAKAFTIQWSLPQGTISTLTNVRALGGSQIETVESVKFSAPRAYSMQNRAITAEDYRNLIYRYYPDAKTVSVWGGENQVPPVYGKVFISVVNKSGDLIDDTDKNYILNNIIRPKMAITTVPVLIDPDFINIDINTTVYFNTKATNSNADTIRSYVANTISNYDATYLERFDSVFKYSKLSRLIDASESSIQSNITSIILRRELVPYFNYSTVYTIDLGNPIYSSGVPEYAVNTSGFYMPDSLSVYYVKDDGIGNLVLYYKYSGTDFVIETIGSVNYTSGYITINHLTITSLESNTFEIFIKPASNDVASVKHQVVRILPEHIKVTVLEDTNATSYIFTPSR